MEEKTVVTNNEAERNEIPKYKGIFKFAIAKSLLEDYGHKLVGIKKNRDGSGNVVFFFENNLQLHYDMQKIIKERRKHFAEVSREDVVEKPMQED